MGEVLARAAAWAGFAVVGGLAAVVFWKLLTRKLCLRGLLSDDTPERAHHPLSVGRAQLLMVSTLTIYAVLTAIEHPAGGIQVPEGLITAQVGRQLVYLAAKAYGVSQGRHSRWPT